MLPSSRTPEGEKNRCPLCGHAVCIEPSRPPGDAPCPHCGTLLWFDGQSFYESTDSQTLAAQDAAAGSATTSSAAWVAGLARGRIAQAGPNQITSADLHRLLSTEFPELREECHGDEEHVHILTDSFRRYTQSAVDQHNVRLVEDCFALAERLLLRAAPELYMVLLGGFLMRLHLTEENRARATEQLPPMMRHDWEEYQKILARFPEMRRARQRKLP